MPKRDIGNLVVIPQAKCPGVRPGPYRIDIFKGHDDSSKSPVVSRKSAVLGSPNKFSLPPGEYRIQVSHHKEGSFSEITSVVKSKETVLTVEIGETLSRGYDDLLLEMKDSAKTFEKFMKNLATDDSLRRKFLRDPNEVLRQAGLLKEGAYLGRKNRLFISLLADKNFAELIKVGPDGINVPEEYHERHLKTMERISRRFLPKDQYLTPEVLHRSIQLRYFWQKVLELSLSNPLVEKFYNVKFERDYVSGLIDKVYGLADSEEFDKLVRLPGIDVTADHGQHVVEVPISVAAIPVAAPVPVPVNIPVRATAEIPIDGNGIYFVFFKISGRPQGGALSQKGAIFVDTCIITNEYIFTDTNFFCDVTPKPGLNLEDRFDYFDKYTVTEDFGDMFDLNSYKVNEIYNIAILADAIIDGMDVMNYDSALKAAQNRLTKK